MLEKIVDEKGNKALAIYQLAAAVIFCMYLVEAVILCLCGWLDLLRWTGSAFFDGILCLAGGFFLAFAHLIGNMLMIQLLNNIQIIREKVEMV